MPTVHVIPLRDQIEHLVPGGTVDEHRHPSASWISIEEDLRVGNVDCPCGPAIERVGRTSWLVTHHSLDGRERYENPPGRFVRLDIRDLPDPPQMTV
jgi:hypothetical protein